ncbi:MAG: TetR/AcrR family transcriptional regulator [Bacteroidota bacterium]|nr:TetR/AcrR family transcriptional regulator [Bacteroidota bacterium]
MSKAERTKELIIEKTSVLFNKKGYAGTSLNDLTDATGLTKGSIYGNFKNKDDVAIEVFRFNLKKMAMLFEGEQAKCSLYRDKLFVYSNLDIYFKDGLVPEGGCPILNTAIESDDTHPELKKQAYSALIKWKNKIIGIIEAGKKQNEFKPELDAETTAITILALLEGGIMIRKLSDNQDYIQMAMKSLRNYIGQL